MAVAFKTIEDVERHYQKRRPEEQSISRKTKKPRRWKTLRKPSVKKSIEVMRHRPRDGETKQGVVARAVEVIALVTEHRLRGEIGQGADDGAGDGLGGNGAGLEELEVGSGRSHGKRSGLGWGRRSNHDG